MRKTLCILGVIMVAALGCKKPNPMVGTWNLELSDAAVKQIPSGMAKPVGTANFKDDGTWDLSVDFMGQKQSGSGTYELKEKTLTLVTKLENGKAPTTASTENTTLSEDMKSFELPKTNGMAKMVKK